jgi:hypothetical protein
MSVVRDPDHRVEGDTSEDQDEVDDENRPHRLDGRAAGG